MDREKLRKWLADGKSLLEIGLLTGRHPSTVGYWVRKYGLTANGAAKYAPRGGLTRDRLESLVQRGLTLAEIANELDRSPSTVRHWLARHGLKLSGHRINRERALAAAERGESRFVGTCRRHGETVFLLFTSGRHRCARCNCEAVVRRRHKVKRMLVEEAGGRCVRCGFDEHQSALHFHHLDPAEKEFGVSHRGATIALSRTRVEAGKCVLLCANCHAMVEAGVASVS